MLENKKADAENICFLRFLADSNRRTRFCRPLTKPLIQGTMSGAKVIFFLIYNTFSKIILCFLFLLVIGRIVKEKKYPCQFCRKVL